METAKQDVDVNMVLLKVGLSGAVCMANLFVVESAQQNASLFQVHENLRQKLVVKLSSAYVKLMIKLVVVSIPEKALHRTTFTFPNWFAKIIPSGGIIFMRV